MLTFVFIPTILTALSSGVSALSSRDPLLLHEKRDTHPTSFESQGPAPSHTPLFLHIAIAQTNITGLKDKLIEISTPGNPAYGRYLTKDEVQAYISPKAAAVQAVQDWLQGNNLTSTRTSPAGDWISVKIPVQQANALLDANFTAFTNLDTGSTAIRTLAYSLPAHLKESVELVHPTVSFPGSRQNLAIASLPQGSIQQSGASSSCDQSITPTCFQQRYGIPSAPATSQTGNQIAVTGFYGGYANETDLKTFLSSYRPDIPQASMFSTNIIDGALIPNIPDNVMANSHFEANLDIEYTVGLATGVPVTFVSVGGNSQDGDAYGWLDVAQSLIAETNPPTVWTTSYGMNESSLSPLLADRICNAYASLGARGTSVIFASGDGGISGPQEESCSAFVPTFPSGCPFITSVGATQNIDPEVAASFSSGGFSNYFATPDYQISARDRYLSTIGTAADAGLYNRSGRGYPDVAAIGQNVEIVLNGIPLPANGTSCSSPIFASVISLLNDELIASGKPPLGFLNPWLYTKAAMALNDITTGKNPGCDTNGFYTMAGWDPVTGLGSPNYDALRMAAGLPSP